MATNLRRVYNVTTKKPTYIFLLVLLLLYSIKIREKRFHGRYENIQRRKKSSDRY